MAISDKDLDGILQQAASLKYKGLDPNKSIALIRESVVGYNQQESQAKAVEQVEPQTAEISLDSAYQTLCTLIESNRDLVKFGVYSWGNVTGHGFANEAHGYRYDAQKREMVWHDSIIGYPTTDPDNELPLWQKALVKFLVESDKGNEGVMAVQQAIQGEKYSQVLADTRGGLYYRVGIKFKTDDKPYNKGEYETIGFVLGLLEKPQQFMELMDRLADRYIPFYNLGIKALEANYQQKPR